MASSSTGTEIVVPESVLETHGFTTPELQVLNAYVNNHNFSREDVQKLYDDVWSKRPVRHTLTVVEQGGEVETDPPQKTLDLTYGANDSDETKVINMDDPSDHYTGGWHGDHGDDAW